MIPDAIKEVVRQCLKPRVHRVTKLLSPELVVRATRRFKYNSRDSRQEVVLTVGKPNYAERDLLRRIKKDPSLRKAVYVEMERAEPKA